MLNNLEKKLLASVQEDVPITPRPYLEIAGQLGISEDRVLTVLQNLCDRGIIRRFGATLRHQKSGYGANAMTAWQVEEDRVVRAGKIMASFSQVSHCYRRDPTPEWPYNIYTMIHAKDEASCREIAAQISTAASVETYTLLFSSRELKKTSMKYFPSDTDNA